MCVYMHLYVWVINICIFVCAQVVGPCVSNIFKYLLNDLDHIFRFYLILEVYISSRHSYLILIAIFTGFNFYFICFLKSVSFYILYGFVFLFCFFVFFGKLVKRLI